MTTPRVAFPQKAGVPEHVPTDEQRKQVRAMTAYGIPQEDVANVLDIDSKTLRLRYRRELDTAAAEANAQVAKRLFQRGVVDGEVSALTFWLKTRARWTENMNLNIGGQPGNPIRVVSRIPRAPGDPLEIDGEVDA